MSEKFSKEREGLKIDILNQWTGQPNKIIQLFNELKSIKLIKIGLGLYLHLL